MICRPLHEERGLEAPVPLPEPGGTQRPEPTPPGLFGADAEGALEEAGAGELLEQRGALASFAAEGMAGSAAARRPEQAAGGAAARCSSHLVQLCWHELLLHSPVILLFTANFASGTHPVVRGFDSPSESGGPFVRGHGADIDLAAPGPTAAGGGSDSGTKCGSCCTAGSGSTECSGCGCMGEPCGHTPALGLACMLLSQPQPHGTREPWNRFFRSWSLCCNSCFLTHRRCCAVGGGRGGDAGPAAAERRGEGAEGGSAAAGVKSARLLVSKGLAGVAGFMLCSL